MRFRSRQGQNAGTVMSFFVPLTRGVPLTQGESLTQSNPPHAEQSRLQ